MEKCPGGEVFDRIVREKRIKESEMVGFCRQMFSAIEFIHCHQIVHRYAVRKPFTSTFRDIKAENFLFAGDGAVKLIDFGLAVRVKNSNEFLTDIVGSPHYIAPEMLKRKYSYSVDLWSAGVLLFLMLLGRYPFEDDTDELILRKVKGGQINWVNPDVKPSSRVLEFLAHLLERDPSRRLSATEALNDPFLRYKSSSERTDTVIVPESVTDKLNSSVVIPGKSRRKVLFDSQSENERSFRISEIEHQFYAGLHRGWRKSSRVTASAPTSPKAKEPNKAAAGVSYPQKKVAALIVDKSSEPDSQDVKRSSSLPGSRVKFDVNPPDVYVYSAGSSAVMKVSPADPRKGVFKN